MIMQLYALDFNKQLVNANQATKKVNYFCLECQSFVRLRAGLHRQSHFYHLQPTIFCRQHQKGAVHLHLQNHLIQNLPIGEVTLECSFQSIRRVADAAWHPQKIIFEVQCSSISAEEVLQRNADYKKIGWQVIWILHDKRYNQLRLSAAEIVLKQTPHFYSNMNKQGKGIIYDQFEICQQGKRMVRLAPLPIQIQSFYPFHRSLENLHFYHHRLKWGFYFKGDLLYLELNALDCLYIKQALAYEKKFLAPPLIFKEKIKSKLKQGLNTLWHLILERVCR